MYLIVRRSRLQIVHTVSDHLCCWIWSCLSRSWFSFCFVLRVCTVNEVLPEWTNQPVSHASLQCKGVCVGVWVCVRVCMPTHVPGGMQYLLCVRCTFCLDIWVLHPEHENTNNSCVWLSSCRQTTSQQVWAQLLLVYLAYFPHWRYKLKTSCKPLCSIHTPYLLICSLDALSDNLQWQ